MNTEIFHGFDPKQRNGARSYWAFLAVFVFLVCLAVPGNRQALAQGPTRVNPETLKGLEWRWIGPAVMGGRNAAVAGVPGDPKILYMGHSTGGLFKSSDGGTTFESVFDTGGTLSVGAIEVSPQNPNVLYLGTGEGNPRNSASYGDGIYKSLDGGKTWKHIGLEKTERIARTVVNPMDPNIVLAAAMGHAWGPNEERGIFRSTDGGTTWKRVLYVNPTTGGSDVAINPTNPNIVYAGMFDYLRKPWNLRAGGPGSGLYRSSDGGETWAKLTDPSLKNGLPTGPIARVGVAVSRSNPNVVYAMVASKEGLLWRSDNGGETWRMVSNERQVDSRPFYFSQVRIDPVDENRVYAVSGGLMLSTDGGRTFRPLSGGGDNHDLWIDPTNPDRVLVGSDMGFDISYNRGGSWDYVNIVPLAQVYHVGYDMAEPYHVMIGLQDHEVWWGPNEKWNREGVRNGDWKHILQWGDGMFAMADPRDPNVIYLNSHFGDFTRINLKTGQTQTATPNPIEEPGGVGQYKYRFNWGAPLLISRHNPDVIYFGGNVLFKTKDQGHSWEVISPDLSTHDPEKLKSSGGDIFPDNSNAEAYCTIFTISEDARDPQTLWVGTDDGNVQITRDGGKSWTNVAGNIQGIPAGSWVSSIEASNREPGRAYISFDRHQFDDFAPYVFTTSDYGKTWTDISAGLESYAHVVREDPKQPNLLYVGTELGVFASFDRGKTWADLRLGLPRVPVYDLVVHPRDNDLILGTHGRGIYILDDVTPLQHLAEVLQQPSALFTPMAAMRYDPVPDMSHSGDREFVAQNKPYGALISYFIAKPAEENAKGPQLQIHDSTGKVIQTLEGTNHAGVNRVVWNFREDVPGAPRPTGRRRGGSFLARRFIMGPQVLPGEYKVSLAAGGKQQTQSFAVRPNPHWDVSSQDLAAQKQTLERLIATQMRADRALRQVGSISEQWINLQVRISDANLKDEGTRLAKKLESISNRLGGVPGAGGGSLINQIAYLRRLVDQYSGRPTQPQEEWATKFDEEVSAVTGELGKVFDQDLKNFNEHLRAAHIPYLQLAETPQSDED